MPIEITGIPALKDNYIWVMTDALRHHAVIIDPGVAKPVHDFLATNNLTLSAILVTHHHWDHTDGIAELVTAYHCPVYGPHIQSPHLSIPALGIELNVIAIPGHTLDHVAFYSPDILFCGDTLFSAGCGRIREGTPEQMYTSLKKLTALPDHTRIYCGHEYTLNNLRFAEIVEPSNLKIKEKIKKVLKLREHNLPTLPTTLQDEKEINPFLRADHLPIRHAVENHLGRSCPTTVAVFAGLREWKNQF